MLLTGKCNVLIDCITGGKHWDKLCFCTVLYCFKDHVPENTNNQRSLSAGPRRVSAQPNMENSVYCLLVMNKLYFHIQGSEKSPSQYKTD